MLFFIIQLSAQKTAPIIISTQNTALVYTLDAKNQLSQLYFGQSMKNTSDYALKKPNNLPALVTEGTGAVREPSFGVLHADNNPSLELQYIKHTTKSEGNVQTTEIQLKDPQYDFYVSLNFKAYQNENVIEQWAEIRHQEKKAVVLEHYASAFLQLNAQNYYLTHFFGDWANEMRMEESLLPEGIHSIESKLGTRATNFDLPSFMLSLDKPAAEESGNVLAGTLAWSGNFKLGFENIRHSEDFGHLLQVLPGINNYASDYVLAPNTTFTTPSFIYTYSYTGKGQASRNLHQWATQYGIYKGTENKSTLLNNWEATYFKFDEQKLTSLLGDAQNLGVDVFLLDDGWFGNKYPRNNDNAGLGDWEANRKKLPNGLPFLVNEAKKRQVKFGIWIEPEMVNPKSELYEKHPDWILKLANRSENLRRTQLVLDLANPKVQEHVFKVVDNILQENPEIGYIKWDCNRYMTNSFSAYLKDKQSNLYIDYTLGLYKVLQRIRDKYPNVEMMWCSGGGGRAEYGGLKYTNEFWPSDNTDPLQRIFIQYGYSYFFPMGIQCAHVTSWGKQPLKFKLDVAMSGKLGFDIRVDEMNDQELKLSQNALKNYKNLQDLINNGEMYRLIAPYNNHQAAWMLTDKNKNKAVLYAYNMNTLLGDYFAPVYFQGLDPDKKYLLKELNLENEDKPQLPQNGKTFSGDYLMKAGLPWFLNGSLKSSVVELTAVN
ncbi:alpha-galactosidase [Elizabethkingia meningoseptica]|uniref:alpha-galactosidase n=1 Tax=Elizabethkingia meningoseptica TaxID=238 RepID=UPI0023B01E03|nr:alpha-galactosidase [Elizabethkingia meningoseptica]MDE5436893.1 alpha-galactosidase [Elizabethkingia meningoseptica]MDE5509080.1 alpha-galactosidase [Elizabethkingia meningoseptica]MDE5514597.1 alpha-galactosidase [Elizabethkingia meningoseptica]MDE5528864.1 alpha-galactosidase [Elizabethkingia meningoseptica]MDE5532420.1 alpha-galactosidase [Elizabethkingia meningoseptica]